MGTIAKNQGYGYDRFGQEIGFTTAAISAGRITSVTIKALGSKMLFSGDKIQIRTAQVNQEFEVSADVSATATSISVTPIEIQNEIPLYASIVVLSKEMIKKASRVALYAHQSIYLTAGTNGNDYLSAYGTSAFSVNSAVTLVNDASKPNRWGAQFGIFVAPYDCDISKIKGTCSSDAGTGDNAVINIWKTTPNTGATGNLTIELVKQFSITSQNNQNHVFDLEDSPTSGNSLSAGDVVFLSIRRSGGVSK
jgi:hypothetical protein